MSLTRAGLMHFQVGTIPTRCDKRLMPEWADLPIAGPQVDADDDVGLLRDRDRCRDPALRRVRRDPRQTPAATG